MKHALSNQLLYQYFSRYIHFCCCSCMSLHRSTRLLSIFSKSLGQSLRTPSSINPTLTALYPSLRRNMATAMGRRLEGKTIVITGASSGIGRSTAIEFARTSPKNLKLILTARRIDTLKQIAEEIKKEIGSGVKVLPVKLDVSKPDEIKDFVPNLPEEFKQIDVLVNNA